MKPFGLAFPFCRSVHVASNVSLWEQAASRESLLEKYGLWRERLPWPMRRRLTARVTGGWGEKGWETGNRQSSGKAPKNAESQPSGARFVSPPLSEL